MKVRRKNRVEIRLSDDELNHLNVAVAKTGLSREAYLRLIIQKIVPAEKPYPDLKETIYRNTYEKIIYIESWLPEPSADNLAKLKNVDPRFPYL